MIGVTRTSSQAATSGSCPTLYSDGIFALMDGAGSLRLLLRSFTYEMLIGLQASPACRIGEPMRLDGEDGDWTEGS